MGMENPCLSSGMVLELGKERPGPTAVPQQGAGALPATQPKPPFRGPCFLHVTPCQGVQSL